MLRIACGCQNNTDCSVVLKLQIDLIQGTVDTGLEQIHQIVLHARKHNLGLRVTESCIVFQHLRTVCSQHQTKEDDALELSSLCLHGIYRLLVNVFPAECIHLWSIERTWGEGSHTAGVQSLVAVLRALMILGRGHDLDGLSVYEG